MKLFMQHKLKIMGVLVCSIIIFTLLPIYDFKAHRGQYPISPMGWHHLPKEVPVSERLYNPKYREAADRILEAMKTRQQAIGAASYSVAVAVKGDLIWAGAIGWADVENMKSATPETRYRIGSTSKAITGTALARLVQKQVIDLDAPISTYISDLANKAWNDITPRMLASHSSGIAHYGQKNVEKDYLGLYRVMALNKNYDRMRDALEIFDDTSLRSAPGSEFYYSSQGTVLLGAVMAAATGKKYIDIINEEVFSPTKMQNTIIAPETAEGHKNMAVSYLNRKRENVHELRQWRPLNLTARLPGGGFAATSSDLAKMGVSYFNDRYISSEIRQIFWTPQKLSNGEVNAQNYALGWRYSKSEIEGIGAIEHANHGGVSRGAQSWLMVIPEQEVAIAINANVKTGQFKDFGLLYKDVVSAIMTVR